MTSWRSLFLQPGSQLQLFRLCQRNRDYLSQWLPWVPHIQQPPTAPPSFRHSIEVCGGADHGHRVSGEVVSVIRLQPDRSGISAKVTIGYWLAERWQGQHHHQACQAQSITPSERWGWRKVAPPSR